MLPGQARDFGVETSSVLMLRSLKKDPSGLELDPERMQVTRSNSWAYFRDLTPLKTVKIHEGSTSFYCHIQTIKYVKYVKSNSDSKL